MGVLYTAECIDCHYVETIHEGIGMAGVTYEPMLCGACRRIVSVPTREAFEGPQIEDKPALGQCPHCASGDVRSWGVFQDDGSVLPGLCPECAGAVELHPTGIWD